MPEDQRAIALIQVLLAAATVKGVPPGGATNRPIEHFMVADVVAVVAAAHARSAAATVQIEAWGQYRADPALIWAFSQVGYCET